MVISAQDHSIIGQGTMELGGNIINGSDSSLFSLYDWASRPTFLVSFLATGSACGDLPHVHATKMTDVTRFLIGVRDWTTLKRQVAEIARGMETALDSNGTNIRGMRRNGRADPRYLQQVFQQEE